MAAENEFPKADGDILFASEVNGFLPILSTLNLPTEFTATTNSFVEVGSLLLTGIGSGIIHSAEISVRLTAQNTTGSEAELAVNYSGANTGNNYFARVNHQLDGGGDVEESIGRSTSQTLLLSRFDIGQVAAAGTVLIPIKDNPVAIIFYLRSRNNTAGAIATVSGITIRTLYNQIGSII